jgi:hypothetical protein
MHCLKLRSWLALTDHARLNAGVGVPKESGSLATVSSIGLETSVKRTGRFAGGN